jgi:hypothetical protein
MPDGQLQTEIQRQEKYLASLPDTFEFPLFNAMTALESQRRSGYRTTAAAAREIVDNAIEAGASWIHVVFDSDRSGKRKSVASVAFIDNGSGMVPRMIQAALSWGGGTHFEEHDFIGKFGFGLPNASINQSKRVEVYSRVDSSEPFHMTYLDVTEFTKFGLQAIPAAKPAKLPKFVQDYLKRNKLDLDHGTVVVWVNPDRLSYRSPGYLREHLSDDFGVVYRYLIKKREDGSGDAPELVVEGVKLEAVDPLFLDPAGRFYEPAVSDGALDEGGARKVLDRLVAVKYYVDPETGDRHLARVEPGEELTPADENLLAVGSIRVRVARFPVGFVSTRRSGGTEARARWEIRKARRGMSFVRANREIETVDAFPRSARDRASGMGDWPLLQGYAYHWGVEVSFHPVLDEVFGITNDKQGVRPIEDFWRVLSQEEIDKVLRAENQWQSAARRDLLLIRREEVENEREEGPSRAELAAQAADTASGRKPRVQGQRKQQADQDLDELAKRRAEELGKGIDEVKAALQQDAENHRYRIEYFENEYAPFFEPKYEIGKFIVRINRKHQFYETLYSELPATAKDAVDLLLIALARAELIVDDEAMATWYPVQRRDVWSPFLQNSLKILSVTDQPVEEELDLSEDALEEEVNHSGGTALAAD